MISDLVLHVTCSAKMATADEDLQFLEGETFHTQKEASKGQVAVKRSSTLKSTKRKTLAKGTATSGTSVESEYVRSQ